MKNLLPARKDLFFPGVLLLIALTAISIYGDAGDFAITVLSFLAVISLLLDSPEEQLPNSGGSISGNLSAVVASIFFLVAGYSLFDPAVFTRTLPLIFLLAFWFTQTGQQLLHRYWKPLLVLLLLAIPDRTLVTPLLYPFLKLFGWDAMTYPTAYFAAHLTTLTGLPASVSQLDIITEHAVVTIWEGCDAVRNMDFLLRLSIILILTVSIKPSRWLVTILVAVLLGFIINVFRITLLAHIVNNGDFSAFDYWHEGDGSKIFNLIAIILFSVFAYFQVSPAASELPQAEA
jgi:cyanoexosortase A